MNAPWSMTLFALAQLVALVSAGNVRAQDSDPNIVEAVVYYGDRTLLEEEELLSDERIEALLDSLCSLEDAPADLVHDLELFRRIRSMDEHAMVLLVDSLFELDVVPYALINEITRYGQDMPTNEEVDHGLYVDWYSADAIPGSSIYGTWITEQPNAYGPELSAGDSVALVRLTDAAQNCGFSMPVPGLLTSRFGMRHGRNHNGIDLDLRTGQPVYSMFPGVVRYAGTYGGYGRLVVVRHYNGLETYYAHLHRIKVSIGAVVDAGDLLGTGGNSGRSTGPHLHLEVRYKGIPIDPSRFLDLSSGSLSCDTLVLKRTRWSFAAYALGTLFHTVQKGEHLYGIAEHYGTSIDELCTLNGISRRSTLRVGQQLLVTSGHEAH